MSTNKYLLKRSIKTDLLNYFRKVLTIPFIDDLIAKRSSQNPTKFWTKIVPPDYLYNKGSIRKVERDGLNFTLDISNYVQHGLYFFGLGQSVFDTVHSEIKNARIIFDVGAHIGTTSIIVSRLNPNARIYSFEPHPVSFKTASDILENNHFTNVSLYNLGLGDKPGKVRLYEVNEHNPGMNRVLQNDQDFPFIEIDISTIDLFVTQNRLEAIDFIKIDVEGFEFSVLKGGEASLRKFKPVLFIELDDNYLRDNGQSASGLIALLFSYGYKSVVNADTHVTLTENSDLTNCHFDILVK